MGFPPFYTTASKHSSWWRRLSSLSSEDVFCLRLWKTSWRCFQDVFIKVIIFFLLICLQKTSSGRLRDVLIKTNILVLVIRLYPIRLQNVFKMFSRRFEDIFKTSSRRFQNVFKTPSGNLQDVFKTFARRIIKLNYSC